MDLVYIIGAVSIVLLIYLLKKQRQGLHAFPGPKGWPIVGNAFHLNLNELHKSFAQWSKAYGGVFKLNLFGREVLVVSSAEAMYELLVTKGKEFAGREQGNERCKIAKFTEAITFMNPGKQWKEIRKSSHRCLKTYDTGMERIVNMTNDVIEDCKQDIAELGSQDIDLLPVFCKATMNIMLMLLVGKKYRETDKVFALAAKTEELVVHLVNADTEAMLLDAVPITKYFGATNIYKKVKSFGETLLETVEELEKECKTSPNKDISLVNALIELGNTSPYASPQSCRLSFGIIIIAGVTTTATTMYAMINLLIHHPVVYKKLQTELDTTLGGTEATLEDRERLPYLMAFINETLRYSSIVPLLIPHTAIVDTSIQGKPVPKETLVFPDVWGLHHDPEVYPDPWEFKPERFLDDKGKLVLPDHKSRKNLYAFGAGYRVCLGENLARTRLFLWTASLLQEFQFKKGTIEASCDPRHYISGVPLKQRQYMVKVNKRFE